MACEVTGHRKKGKGLEVPCKYIFTGKRKMINKLKHIRGALSQNALPAAAITSVTHARYLSRALIC